MAQYIAAYDISHDSARRKVASVLLGFGVRIQQSVFHLELETTEIPYLQRQVGAHLVADDKFDLIPMDLRTHRVRLAWQHQPDSLTAVVII